MPFDKKTLEEILNKADEAAVLEVNAFQQKQEELDKFRLLIDDVKNHLNNEMIDAPLDSIFDEAKISVIQRLLITIKGYNIPQMTITNTLLDVDFSEKAGITYENFHRLYMNAILKTMRIGPAYISSQDEESYQFNCAVQLAQESLSRIMALQVRLMNAKKTSIEVFKGLAEKDEQYEKNRNPSDIEYKKSSFKLIIANACYYDNPLVDLFKPTYINYSSVDKGVFNHVKLRVLTPLNSTFTVSFNNQYFFKPFSFEHKIYSEEKSNKQGFLFSIVMPVLFILNPAIALGSSLALAALYVVYSVVNFCQAIHSLCRELINSNSTAHSKSIAHLTQSASNLIIGICMPFVSTIAQVTDAVRTITRLTATVLDALPVQGFIPSFTPSN